MQISNFLEQHQLGAGSQSCSTFQPAPQATFANNSSCRFQVTHFLLCSSSLQGQQRACEQARPAASTGSQGPQQATRPAQASCEQSRAAASIRGQPLAVDGHSKPSRPAASNRDPPQTVEASSEQSTRRPAAAIVLRERADSFSRKLDAGQHR
jgi:hypothetical protein